MKKEAIIGYEIYVKSFKDSNNDGIGDLGGVIEKISYLEELGINLLWLTPIYESPQFDNGYDISDYKKIDKVYGTMQQFEDLIRISKKSNIKIMIDLVFNHTSTKHKWFLKAINGNKKYQDYYFFKNSNKDGGPPTNWKSRFGGGAWKYVKNIDKWYLHIFGEEQADLNWENQDLILEIYDIVNFWIEKGVSGFRFDVINLVSKPTQEEWENDLIGDGRRFYTDGKNIHKYLEKLNLNTFGKKPEIITVGELSSTSKKESIRYSNKSGTELDMNLSKLE